MAKYYLSRLADEGLLNISIYGYENFGVKATENYRDKLLKRFQIIADDPYMYPVVEYLRTGHQRSVCGSHSIYYKISPDGLDVIRILGRQDAKKALFK